MKTSGVIAVADGDSGFILPSLKRHALFFDQIAIINLESYLNSMGSGLYPEEAHVAEIEFLHEHNFIIDPDFRPHSQFLGRSDYSSSLSEYLMRSKKVQQMLRDLKPGLTKAEDMPWDSNTLIRTMNESAHYRERCACIQLRKAGYSAFPLIGLADECPLAESEVSKQKVLEVVLLKLPVPSQNTPWESILDFRAEKDHQGLLHGLRHWMNDISRQGLAPSDIEEKLESMLYEYQKAMDVQKLKQSNGLLEGLVVTTTEVLENLLKVQWSNLAKQLFSLRTRNIELMEAEMKAPGHQVSYLVKAQETFNNIT